MQPIIYWVNEYYGNRGYLLFAIVAYIYLFFATKESRRKIVYPSVLLAFLVLNPILYKYVYSKIIYWRLMWLLPNTLAIAYATVLFVRKRKHIAVKVIAFVLVLAAVSVTKCYTSIISFSRRKVENNYFHTLRMAKKIKIPGRTQSKFPGEKHINYLI